VWAGYTILDEGIGAVRERALIKLSRGGADATVCREFDILKQEWIKDQPFNLPEAKMRVW
jgi:prolyl oligopeptidase